MKFTPDIPPLWTLGAALSSWGLAKGLPIVSWKVSGLGNLGLFWVFMAVLLVLWSALYFWKKKTTIEPHRKPTTLIKQGPYRITRNPIYVAMVLATAGFALWLGALSALLPVVALGVILHKRFVMPEERGLREVFGEEAETYIAKTKRWV